ncbi:MAG TPA: gliding motility protein, partial [Myxococcaceae bacterium]|nr:gliding motility protein [Myxococcaceae bacterium]
RLAAETGSFDALASAYEEQLGLKNAEPRAEMLWRRLASLYGERLGRIDAAVRAWQQVLAREPKDAPALDSLARLYRQSGAFGPLAAVMKEQIALEPNARRQVSHLFELARLAEESLSDRALAASAYEQILEREPDEPNALKLLERVLSQTERWADLAALIEREIRLAEQRSAREESFDLRVRLGRLKLSRLGDPGGALAILSEVLRLKTGHAGALAALEEMARSDNPLRAEAAAALEPLFAAAGDHLRLVQMLESLASAEPALKARVALLRRVADVYAGPMKNAEMAFVAAARALRELPDDEASLELCLKLVDAAEATDDLVALLVEIASKASDDGARVSLYRALGRLRQRQRDPAGALETWRRVLELSPADEEALDALARLYALLGRGRELLDVLRRQLAATEEPSRRALLLLQIGTLQEEHLKDNLGALATFRLLLELRPEDSVALERMDLLTEKLQRWPELADVLSRRLQREGQGGGADLKFRLAVVRESRLMDKLGAVQLYAEILSAQPDHADALLRLEGILERDPKNRAAAAALLKALRSTGDATKLAEALERRIGASDAGERKALLLELAQIRAAQNEPELEYLARYRAFKDDPNDRSLRDALEGAADSAGSWEELTHAYEEELPRIAEAFDAGEVCLRLATLLEEKLGQADRAALYYEKARGLNPELDARILPALERLYTQLGKPEQLAGVLEVLVGKSDDRSAKAALLFKIGGLCQEHLGDLGRATRAYEQALELDPTHLGAAQLLEQLYQAAGNNDRLYAVLRLQRDSATGAERERILSKMAEVSAEGLSDVAQSIDLYRELLAKNPRNEQAYASLEQLLERDGRFEELAELLAQRLRQAVEPRELARVNDKLGRTLHLKLGRGKEAIAHFKAAL